MTSQPIPVDYSIPSAAPTLKVMRIQSPQLSKTQAPSISSPVLSSCLILPDSFGVIHIGETFTAYLGAINVSQSSPITNLSVSSTLQTPTKRWPLSCILENKQPSNHQERQAFKPVHIFPQGGVDAIISIPLEEVGQHILRVDVSYGGPDPKLPPPSQQQQQQQDEQQMMSNSSSHHPRKTLRKFYRFQVSSPLHMKELTVRGGESCCFVSLAVENASPNETSAGNDGGLTISQTEFQPLPGLIAKSILTESNVLKKKKSAVELFDECGRLDPGASKRYMFLVKAATEDASLRGIAKGDELGKAVVTWRKAMGEAGRIASTFVCCPSSDLAYAYEEREALKLKKMTMNQNYTGLENSVDPDLLEDGQEDRFVVHGSGLSVDVAASAVEKSAGSHAPSEISSVRTLDVIFPVTVEPIDPPSRMVIGKPVKVQLLIVNHGSKHQNLQLQMRLPSMKGVVVYGQSYQNLGNIAPDGGSEVATITLVAMAPGLFFVNGCYAVNLNTGMEIKQPALFSVFVDGDEEKKDDIANA